MTSRGNGGYQDQTYFLETHGEPNAQAVVQNYGPTSIILIVFFTTALIIFVSACAGVITNLMTFQIASATSCLFLMAFGGMLTVLSVPGKPQWGYEYRCFIHKYCRFLTLMIGQSIWLIFMGALLAVSLWPSPRAEHYRVFLFFSLLVTIVVLIVAFIGIAFSMRETVILNDLRALLRQDSENDPQILFNEYAMDKNTTFCMSKEEFKLLVEERCGQLPTSHALSPNRLDAIFSVMDEHWKGGITDYEFKSWMESRGLTYL